MDSIKVPARHDERLTLPTNQSIASAYRWVILLLCWGALLFTFVDRLAWGSVAASVGSSLGLPVGALGVFVTAFYAGYVLSNVAGGVVVDLFGPRRIIALSLLLLGVCTFLFGHTTSVAYGLATQGLMGLVSGCDYAACVKLITAWFDLKHRGRAMGLMMTATSLAVVITNAIVPKMLAATGWSQIYALLGIATSIFAMLCFVILRDGSIVQLGNRQRLNLKKLLGNRNLALLALAGFGGMWGTWGFVFWGNALMTKRYGISPTHAGFVMVLVGIGAVVSKPIIGLLSDWMGGRRKALISACFCGFSILLLVFGMLERESQFHLIAPLLGIAAFAWSPLIALMIAETAGISLSGSATGVTNGIWQLANVAVPLVVGTVFQFTHSFPIAFGTLAAGPLLAAGCMCFVNEAVRT
ncbi:MFS transporter [Pandoraea sp.]|uniref:MFS transporter n=1 Tax=Pandoraea sp. TaxID=1883445 RepID=UPI0012282A0B|nr:MFS transporter [Pandoraea sp.]TAL53043.1 MAG: MFS transporter [Pandoraea sp.]TAM16597.1 MAG: MFS transporter [Pandoraea sp.]